MSKTADDVQVGDVVLFDCGPDGRVRIKLTEVYNRGDGTTSVIGVDSEGHERMGQASNIAQILSSAFTLVKAWQQVETFSDLKKFVEDNMNGCNVTVIDSEIVILTGAGYDMGGILYGLNEDE